MVYDLSQLELRYFISCKEQKVLPSYPVLFSFVNLKHQDFRILEIFIDELTCSDILPLVAAFSSGGLSDIDAVDVCQKSSNPSLTGECILSLLHAVNPKLRVVDLIDWSLWKDILQDICHRGLACQVLNLRFSPIRELELNGKFMQLNTLNLDSSIHLTSFQINCFSCMPQLMHVSMCSTRVSNLWTTTAALLKLPSLVELRFQSCLCCYGTGPCPKSGECSRRPYRKNQFAQQHSYTYARQLSLINENFLLENLQYMTGQTPSDLHSDDDFYTDYIFSQTMAEESSDEGESDFSRRHGVGNWEERLHDATLYFHDYTSLTPYAHNNMLDSGSSSIHASYQLLEAITHSSRGMTNGISEIDELRGLNNNNNLTRHASLDEFISQLTSINNYFTSKFSNENHECSSVNMLDLKDTIGTSEFAPERPTSHNPSPICFEKYYREYILSSLARLKVLDNLPIKEAEREKANETIKKYYEHIPYNRRFKESVLSILQKREVGTSGASYKYSQSKQPYSRGSSHLYTRSLAAAKVSSSQRPHFHSISKFKSLIEGIEVFRPRQFEYHPANPSLMAFGTLNGELVIINHESQKLVGYLPSVRALHSVLGLCWLKKYPSKLIAGSDSGSLQLYDVSKMASTVTDRFCVLDACVHTFDEFEQLTSVHVNSTDDYFLASGFSKHVALYDIGSGRLLQYLKDLHQEHINVVKFSHHSPMVFATASFDQNVRMWDLRQGMSRPCYTTCSSRGNVMVCFSPDDHYLLSSAIDNEVKQLLAVDGRLHMQFDIASIGSSRNYTRSYYMNGRDHIITGSCEENVVRVCCAQTGRRLRDISFEGNSSRYSMYVQSLRGDPYRLFHMSVLAAYMHPSTRSEIIKVNLLESGDHVEGDSFEHGHSASSMGG
ncbi:uncharacterized protein LOC109819700 isoform X2 [Asparagus officinalis]|uniref:uncharacterized protein LOC109819700 isoform X2 n=1 Tax=Asparagus officinalis TaxID=4686 RepID=UPI00098E3DF7|nr:uncharacterized protein LOC109819700 isoform X2 [Asparagus officinalis]